jgi:alkaline phosphatase D
MPCFAIARAILFFFAVLFFAASRLAAQSDLLQSGPMLGYSDMKETLLWVQTKSAAKVRFDYWEKESPNQVQSTEDVYAVKENAFTCKAIANRVKPGKRYGYALYINGKKVERPYPMEFQTQMLWQWRTDPPEFTVALGSCFYVNEESDDRPGKGYGSDYEIMTALHQKRPDMMVWLGDNTYLRDPDWNTREGIFHRYTHTRSLPELQALLASTHHYATWDDHDYGPNDADRSFWNKAQTLDAFKLFWGNPVFGAADLNGVTSQVAWNDVEFFLLDDRTNRAPNNRKTGERTIIGKAQMDWLIDALATSRATFKIIGIGGQFLNTLKRNESYSNIAPDERQAIIDAITAEGIRGVFFITGDVHYTELSKLERKNTYPLYDLTCSSLTAGSNMQALDQQNTLRIPETVVMPHNFAILKFSGALKERVMTISVYDKTGATLWTRDIKASELK